MFVIEIVISVIFIYWVAVDIFRVVWRLKSFRVPRARDIKFMLDIDSKRTHALGGHRIHTSTLFMQWSFVATVLLTLYNFLGSTTLLLSSLFIFYFSASRVIINIGWPAEILILGASGQDSIDLHNDFSRKTFLIYKIVSLFSGVEEHKLKFSKKDLIYFGALRAKSDANWIQSVVRLIDMAGIIFVDLRHRNPAIESELAIVLSSDAVEKCYFLVEEKKSFKKIWNDQIDKIPKDRRFKEEQLFDEISKRLRWR